jgi:hypothetical protein
MTSRFPVSNLLITVGPAGMTGVSESHHKVGHRLVGQTPAARRGREPTIRQATPIGPPESHFRGMNRIRVSATVDAELLSSARNVRSGITDAALIDEALGALLARHRSAEVDASYAAYDKHPADEPDEWGDLASWRRAAGAS